MKEDKEFEDFVRGRLEGEFAGEPPRLDAIIHAASEAAASRAASRRLSASVATLQTGPSPSDDTIAEVIDLLRSEGDGNSVSDGTSAVDRLLAWQDAPYEQAISGLQTEN